VVTEPARAADAPNPLHRAGRLQELIVGFGVEAMTFTAKRAFARDRREVEGYESRPRCFEPGLVRT
jgi:hypothetical protein